MEMSGQLHAPEAVPPGKEHLVPIGPQSRSGRGGEGKNSQHPSGIVISIIFYTKLFSIFYTKLYLPYFTLNYKMHNILH
jgi:hypothetical protein